MHATLSSLPVLPPPLVSLLTLALTRGDSWAEARRSCGKGKRLCARPSPRTNRNGTVPHRCLAAVLPHMALGPSPEKGDAGKQCGREALTFALLPLLSLSFFRKRILVASWVTIASSHPLLHSGPEGSASRDPGSLHSQHSPLREEALAVIMENCPAKKVVAGKASEGEVGEKTGRGWQWGGVRGVGKL